MVAHVPWGQALKALFVPEIERTAAYATAFVAILGTTISPYLFFWQAGQEIEEERRSHAKPLCVTPKDASAALKRHPHRHVDRHGVQHARLRRLVFATAATLNAHGITDIETSSQAARGPSPVAGRPRLPHVRHGHHRHRAAGGTGPCRLRRLCDDRDVRDSVQPRREAVKSAFFYAVIAATTFAGASLQAIGINPVKALYWSAVDQRGPGCAADGADDADRAQSARDGTADAVQRQCYYRLGSDADDGCPSAVFFWSLIS